MSWSWHQACPSITALALTAGEWIPAVLRAALLLLQTSKELPCANNSNGDKAILSSTERSKVSNLTDEAVISAIWGFCEIPLQPRRSLPNIAASIDKMCVKLLSTSKNNIALPTSVSGTVSACWKLLGKPKSAISQKCYLFDSSDVLWRGPSFRSGLILL